MTPLLYLQEARKNLVLRRGNKPTNPAEHGDGEADGEVCDVVGEDVGGVGDPDPALAALGEVDAVDADGEGGEISSAGSASMSTGAGGTRRHPRHELAAGAGGRQGGWRRGARSPAQRKDGGVARAARAFVRGRVCFADS